MKNVEVEIGQIWANKLKPTYQLEVFGKVGGGHYKTRILTKKTGVYAGTHTVTKYTLWKKYDLL